MSFRSAFEHFEGPVWPLNSSSPKRGTGVDFPAKVEVIPSPPRPSRKEPLQTISKKQEIEEGVTETSSKEIEKIRPKKPIQTIAPIEKEPKKPKKPNTSKQ